MAKDREMPCKYYICVGKCEKGRQAVHNGYCQKCSKYYPRAKMTSALRKPGKRDKLDKLKSREAKNFRY